MGTTTPSFWLVCPYWASGAPSGGCRIRGEAGQGGRALNGEAGLPGDPRPGKDPARSHLGLVNFLGGVAQDCARKRLGPPWSAIGERAPGRSLGESVSMRSQVIRRDLGVRLLYHGGVFPAAGRTNPGAEGKGRTGETYQAPNLTPSCTRGLGAVRRVPGFVPT